MPEQSAPKHGGIRTGIFRQRLQLVRRLKTEAQRQRHIKRTAHGAWFP